MLWLMIFIVCLALIGLGFLLNPKPFPTYPETMPEMGTVAVSDSLPPPVNAFYQAVAGDMIPIIKSVVITGRGVLRFSNVPIKARMRFTHRTGYDYRHYIELMWFGRPITKVNEHYRDGKGYMNVPFGTFEDLPELNSGANQAIWGEAIWFPTIFLTDLRARWEGIDHAHARLIVPYEQSHDEPEQVFIVTFDLDTHLIQRMETMRYRDIGKPRVNWILEGFDWKLWHGLLIPSIGTVTWADQGYPWLTLCVEEVVYNVDVSDYLLQSGL